MTNEQLLFLANSGFMSIDYSPLNPKASYLVYRFRRALTKALNEFGEQRVELIKNTLTQEELSIIERLEQKGEQNSEEYRKIASKVTPIITELLRQTITFDNDKISAEDYFNLKATNPKILNTYADELLEGVLWEEKERGDE